MRKRKAVAVLRRLLERWPNGIPPAEYADILGVISGTHSQPLDHAESPRALKLLALLRERPMTVKELADVCGVENLQSIRCTLWLLRSVGKPIKRRKVGPGATMQFWLDESKNDDLAGYKPLE